MTHRLNARGYTLRSYLRKTWWRNALILGMLVVIWRGSQREAMTYVFFVLAVILLDTLGRPLVGFCRGVREGWRSK
jgi:hypothetical protein